MSEEQENKNILKDIVKKCGIPCNRVFYEIENKEDYEKFKKYIDNIYKLEI